MYPGVPFCRDFNFRNDWQSVWTKIVIDLNVCDRPQHSINTMRVCMRDFVCLCPVTSGFSSHHWFKSTVFQWWCFHFLFGNNFKYTESLQTTKIIQRMLLFDPDLPTYFTPFTLSFLCSLHHAQAFFP